MTPGDAFAEFSVSAAAFLGVLRRTDIPAGYLRMRQLQIATVQPDKKSGQSQIGRTRHYPRHGRSIAYLR